MSTSVSPPLPASMNPTRQQLEELDALLKRMLDLPGGPEDEDEESPPRTSHDARAVERLARTGGMANSSADEASPPSGGPVSRQDSRPRYLAPNVAPPSSQSNDEPVQVPEFRSPNPDDWVKLAATWQPSPQTWGPLAETWKQSSRPTPPVDPVAAGVERLLAPLNTEEPLDPSIPTEVPVILPVPHDEDEAPPPAVDPSPFEISPPSFSSPIQEITQAEKATAPAPEEATPVFLWPLVAINVIFDLGLMLFGPLGQWLKIGKGRTMLGVVGLVCLVVAAGYLAADTMGLLGDVRGWLADWFGWTL